MSTTETTPVVPSVEVAPESPVTPEVPAAPSKPGWQTTEFWISLGGNFVGLLVLGGVFSSGDAESVTSAYNEVVGAVVLGLTNLTYIWSRTKVKTTPPVSTPTTPPVSK